MNKPEKNISHFLGKIKRFYVQKPMRLLPTVALLTVLTFGVEECVRARYYLQQISYYKNSSRALQLHDTVQALQKSVESTHSALYCDVRLQEAIDSASTSYRVSLAQQSDAHSLNATLQEHIGELSPPPAFSSLVEFLPGPSQARILSEELADSVQSLQVLTQKNARSEYCLELSNVLEDVYFIQQLTKPEGVHALLAGQLENYQIKAQGALDKLLVMKFPVQYADEHDGITAAVSQLTLNLVRNENDVLSYAGYMQDNYDQLIEQLESIEKKSIDLQEIPKNIALQASYLR